jgi:hypothetical protein
MNYTGKLYGKIGPRAYVPLKLTSEDVDALEKRAACLAGIENPQEAIAAAREALSGIPEDLVMPGKHWIAINKALSLLTPKL